MTRRLNVWKSVKARRGGSRTGRPPSKGAKVGLALGDVILGAIPYGKTELDLSPSARGLMSPRRASVPVRPELRRRGGTLDSIMVAAAISYDRRHLCDVAVDYRNGFLEEPTTFIERVTGEVPLADQAFISPSPRRFFRNLIGSWRRVIQETAPRPRSPRQARSTKYQLTRAKVT
jgi:hypothetical protein